jgi:glycosyltransferase involved in cell wall biosynthesis
MGRHRISIDPRTNVVYASLYIHGLYEMFGRNNVIYSYKPFRELIQKNGKEDFDHYFAFYDHAKNIKYVVDFRDKNTYNHSALQWSNIYGKINFNSTVPYYTELPVNLKKKIVKLAPNFGIKIYGTVELYLLLLLNFVVSRIFLTLSISLRQFSSAYNWMNKRQKLEDYLMQSETENDYIFHASTFYSNQNYGEKTNQLRAEFIRACRANKNFTFEGGLKFSENISNADRLSYEDVSLKNYVPNNIYLEKIKKSSIVFSTPAAWGCHGWKLAEYFAMGKVIVSTPFYNDTPDGISNNGNMILVRDLNEINRSMSELLNDPQKLNKIRIGSEKYYIEHVSPKAALIKLFGS